jgi:hypothetical protein
MLPEEMLVVETAEEFDNGKSHLAVSVGRYSVGVIGLSSTLGVVGGKMILDQEDYLIGGSVQLFNGPEWDWGWRTVTTWWWSAG